MKKPKRNKEMKKRKARKAREWWISVDKDSVVWGEALGSYRDKKEELEQMYPKDSFKIIKVREVLRTKKEGRR